MKVSSKKENGITLIALVITIVILLTLASITIGTLTGNNGLIEKALNAKERNEIANEKEIVEIASTQAMKKNKWGEVTKTELQKQLDKSTGEGITGVTEEIEDAILLAKFLETQRIYEVDKDGNVTYLGEETKLLEQATITANPSSNITPQLVQSVELNVKTPLSIEDENITLVYSWSSSNTQKPADENYTKATLAGTKRNRKTTATSIDTEAGEYYLWAKVLVGENQIEETFGPYAIKDHTTLVACNSETGSESGFLGNTEIKRNEIESVTIATSLGSHTTSEANCWDVSQSQDGKYLAWYEDSDSNGYYEVTIAGNGGVVANSNSSYLFRYIGYNGEDATVFYGLENLDTGLVTSMEYMFSGCRNATNLDLRTFKTTNVTSMAQMFNGCSNLVNLNLSSFNTSNVTNVIWMFCGCNSLTSLDVSNFDTSNMTNMIAMFYGCRNLISLDVSNFDTSNVTDMNAMFYACNSLTSINLSNFNTSNVKNMNSMFNGCSNLTSLDVSSFNTTNVTNMQNMFSSCSSLTILDVNSFDTTNVTNMIGMFDSCSSLTSMGVSKFNTSKVTSMHSMFARCSKLQNLDLSNFSTTNVTDMIGMFDSCSSLTSINVSNFNTSKVTGMHSMFARCSKLQNLDLSSFSTSNVSNMAWMFTNCSSLTNLNLNNFETSNVTSMGQMFHGCSQLTNLNINRFDMSNVADYGYWFNGVPTTISITTNSSTASWLNTNFPSYTNITIVD